MNAEELLHDIDNTIGKYSILPSGEEYVASTLWVAYTHFAGAFDFAPRLIVRSPQKRSGKTRLLEVVSGMVRNPLRSTSASGAAIYRSLGTDLHANPKYTLIFDEVDTWFNAGPNEDLRNALNTGYQRGNSAIRVGGSNGGFEVQHFATFAPAALAGIGRLPDTIEDRAVAIHMRRKSPDEKVTPYRVGRDGVELHALRERLAEWSDKAFDEAKDYALSQISLPVDDRAADIWEPLIIVAEMAGGDWPLVAREACKLLTFRAEADDTDFSPGQQLLSDIRVVFVGDFMGSGDLCAALNMLPESPWHDEMLNTHRLARKLKEYDIHSTRNHAGTQRGYYRAAFRDAWVRYLSEPSDVSVPSDTYSDQDISRDAYTSADTSMCQPSIEAAEQKPSSEPISDTSDAFDASTETKAVATPLDAARQAELIEKGRRIALSGKYAPKASK
jgi:hypothetical protein